MVDILTDTGVFLDLDPEAEFEITIENPLLQDDRIPVPFSTAIAFLPTPTNKRVFGYLDSMMLEPRVKQLGASILVGGVPPYVGTLKYDNIDEDGRVNYTFSAKDLQTEWGGKIWETEIAEAYYPLIVDASKTAAAGIGVKPTGSRPGNLYNIDAKYRNHPNDVGSSDKYARLRLVPAVPVRSVLGSKVSFSEVDGASGYLSDAVILGTWAAGLPNIGATLPDIGFADFILGLCKMFCAALFVDGAGYRILAATDILNPSGPLEWDGKISARFRSATEEGEGYSLGYGGSDDGSSGDTEAEPSATLSGVVSGADTEYETVQHTPTGDVYSRKINTVSMNSSGGHSSSSGGTLVSIGTIDEILIDCVGTSGKAVTGEGMENVRQVEIGFKLPKCAPSGWTKHPNGSADDVTLKMCPILSLPASGAVRPTDVYIALYGNGQACDKGVVIANSDSASSADQTIGPSLAPEALFERYHQVYAAWLAKDRQVLSVDLNLSVMELAAFRMWQAVRVRSRNFLVSKLSVRVAASADGVDASAELISL